MSKFFRVLVFSVIVNLSLTPSLTFAVSSNPIFKSRREIKISQYLDNFEKKMKTSEARKPQLSTLTNSHSKIEQEWQKKLREWLGLDGEDRVVTGLRLGYLWGNTAYDFNHHTSELEFPMDNWMVGAELKAELDKINFSVNTALWLGIEKDAGPDMKDKDWDVNGVLFPPGTLFSYTKSNTKMFPIIFDINGRYDFYRKKILEGENSLGILLGFTYEKFDYEMFGIHYITDLLFGHQGETLYPERKVLTYKIKYYLPYIGLASKIIREKWGLGFSMKYSFLARAKDKDQHLLRDLTFYGDYDDGKAYMGSISYFWKFAQQWKLKLGVEATFIRIDGQTQEAGGSSVWDKDQSTDARIFLGWTGIEYTF